MSAGALCFGGIVLFVALAAIALLTAGGAPASAGSSLFDAYIWRVARFTLLQAALSTLLSVLLAIPVARALVRQPRFPGRVWIVRLMALPLGLPALVGALGIITIWGRQGLVNDGLAWLGLNQPVSIYGLSGILIAHVFFNLPLAVRYLVAGLERIPGEYWRLGANLGMRSPDLFRFVEWPVIRRLLPGIASLIFMLCATSFTLVLTLGGGPAATTIEVAIYQAMRFDFDPPRAIALSFLQIGITGILLLVARLLPQALDDGSPGGIRIERFDGRAIHRRILDGILILLAAIFVSLPLLAVLVSGLAADFRKLLADSALHQALLTSAAIALGSAALCVTATACLVRGEHAAAASQVRSPLARSLGGGIHASTSLVLLVPPVVLGSGWFLLLRPLGDTGRFAPFIIVAINVLMTLPFVYRVLQPAYADHVQKTGRLAVSLGLTGFQRLRINELPALRRPLLMAFSFAAALSLGDLGAVALFGSQDIVTLPWLLYSRMGSYRTADAAGIALLLGAICLLLTILGTWQKRETDEYGHD